LIARGKDQRESAIFGLHDASFFSSDLSNIAELAKAVSGCDALVHCAGINRQIGQQTYQRVHIDATKNAIDAARRAGVHKIVLLSFLRARANCGSAYHESKWVAEELVRLSGLDYTIFKAGVIYGRGDHMLDHLSHALFTFPLFGLVGMKDKRMRPLAVEDLVHVLEASLSDCGLSRRTFHITGPEEMTLREAVRRVGHAVGRVPGFIHMPVVVHKVIAWLAERTMKIPLTSLAQVRILAEGLTEAAPPCDTLPADLQPTTNFTPEQIQKHLPEPGAFRFRDLRCVPR
jgi:NADH dehydrogenase